MLLKEIICEDANRAEYVADKMKDQLLAAAMADSSFHGMHDDPKAVVAELLKADPTPNKQNIVFLSRMYGNKQFRMEDLSRIKKELETFVRVSKKLANRDLNSYKNLQDLYDAIEPFEDKVEEISAKRQKKMTKQDAVKLMDAENFKVIIPKTHDAACLYGANTKWCTASRDDATHFDTYHAQGPLMVIIAKDPKTGKDRKFQLHYESGQFMNEKDQALTKADISFLSKFDEYGEFIDNLVHHHYTKYGLN